MRKGMTVQERVIEAALAWAKKYNDGPVEACDCENCELARAVKRLLTESRKKDRRPK